jgi:hypothetical protein
MLHYPLTGRPRGRRTGRLPDARRGDRRDAGYGPARLHGPAETEALSRFLDAQDLARLQARVDYEMSRLGVYAMPLVPDPVALYEDELRNEVAFYFPLLRDYACTMSEKGNGLLTWV